MKKKSHIILLIESIMACKAQQTVKDEYEDWVNDITNNNTTYPKQFSDFGVDANNVNKYYHFLGLFYQHSSYANIGLKHNSMQPNALLNIFSTSNCK